MAQPLATRAWRQPARLLAWAWRGLFQEKVPLWLYMAVIIAGIVATVVVAPMVNRAFERDRLKTDFVTGFLNSVNTSTGELVTSVSAYRWCTARKLTDCDGDMRSADRAAAALQWRALQMRALLTRDADRAAVDRFQRALEGVADELEASEASGRTGRLDERTRAFATVSLELVRRIARQSGVSLRW